MEQPLIKKSWNKNTKTLAIVYPNLYYGGIYCLAPLIIYNQVNSIKNWICDRKFLDKDSNLSKYDLVGFTYQYELDIKNIINLIKKHSPKLTFAGGPCINNNLRPLLNHIDFFILGESEEILPKVLKHFNKKDFLKKISDIPGIYVPKYSKKIIYSNPVNLDKTPYPLYQPLPLKLNKKFVFGSTFLLEIERGCPFRCKFCPMPHIHPKVRQRSLNNIKKIIDQGIKLNQRNKITIYSPSFTHPKRKEILKYILSKNLNATIPSIKVEFMNEELLYLIKKLGQKTLTIAPECNESLRFKIGKPVKDKAFFNFIELADKLNFNIIKLYFMIGLPNQTLSDIDAMILFIKKIRNKFKNKIYISINPFVPKPKTEFSNYKFNKTLVKQQAKHIKKNLNKLKIRYKIPSIENSYLEYKYANYSGASFSNSSKEPGSK